MVEKTLDFAIWYDGIETAKKATINEKEKKIYQSTQDIIVAIYHRVVNMQVA